MWSEGKERGDGLVEDAVGALATGEALASLGEPLDRAGRVEEVAAEGDDGIGTEGLATDQAREREVLVLAVAPARVGAASVAGVLLGHEGPGGGGGGQKRVVELPAVEVVAAVVQELARL